MILGMLHDPNLHASICTNIYRSFGPNASKCTNLPAGPYFAASDSYILIQSPCFWILSSFVILRFSKVALPTVPVKGGNFGPPPTCRCALELLLLPPGPVASKLAMKMPNAATICFFLMAKMMCRNPKFGFARKLGGALKLHHHFPGVSPMRLSICNQTAKSNRSVLEGLEQ